MLHAEELLRETDMPIKAIAYSCGVPDIRYFARKFKTFFDCTPSEFRKKMVESPGRKMTQLDSCVVD
jgi:AraC-like DNA-binding protein